MENSNYSIVTLKDVDFEAAGSYYCEVSIDSPIYTKESNEETLHVIGKSSTNDTINHTYY